MTALSSTAWVLHDLGLAADFGGSLFGQLALHPAVRAVTDERERGKVVHEAWHRESYVNTASLALMAGTWLVGRTMLTGRELGRDVRKLTLLKDALVSTAVLTGIGSMITGRMLAAQAPGGAIPIRSGNEPSPRATAKTKALQRTVNAMGAANLAITGGVIAVTAVLAMKAGKSSAFTFISRLLP